MVAAFGVHAPLIVLAQSVPVHPASVLKRMTVEQLLQQEVVSVTRTPEPLGQAASSVFLIPGQSAQGAGVDTLPQLLRLAPNLFVAQANSSSWAVSARGFSRASGQTNKMLVLIDGRTVYSPLFSGVFWDTQDLFLPDLDRVEVISGPAGSAWGSNAVNGVINVVTKSAAETQGSVVYAGLGTATESSFGIRHGGRLGGDGFFRVYAKRTEFDSTLSAAGLDDGADAWQFAQLGFRMDWGENESGAFTLQGDGYRGHYTNPGNPRDRNDGGNLLARWQRTSPDGVNTIVRVYHDYALRDISDSIAHTLRTTDLEIQQTRPLGAANTLTWGGFYRLMNDDVRNPPAGLAILPAHTTRRLWSLFVEDKLQLRPDSVQLTLGSRFEHNDTTGWEIQPSVRVAWRTHPRHTLWTALSRAARTPSRIDTDIYVPEVPPFVLQGGAEFRAEILHAYELGWRGQLQDNLAATLTLYYHDYDHLRSVEATTPMVLSNRVAGHSYGAELFVDWDVTSSWRFRFGYFRSIVDTHLKPGSLDLEDGLGESSHPDYQLQVRSGLQLTRDIRLWAGLRHVGSVPARQGAISGLVPSYTELDARIGWTFRPGVELSLTGRNLLHRSHSEIGLNATRREIERSAGVVLRWDF